MQLKRSICFLVLVLLCSNGSAQQAMDASTNEAELPSTSYDLVPILHDLPLSWALAVSPQNDIWLTHRNGNISKVMRMTDEAEQTSYQLVTYTFSPADLLMGGQGGLLDIIFHPDYAQNGWIYVSYSSGSESENALKVVRLRTDDERIRQVEDIFTVFNKKDTPVHYGGRLAFTADNALLLTSGDGFDYREQAQVKDNQLGKVLRMTDTGLPHPQNPFYQAGGEAQAFVLSLGHRNPQGLLVTSEQIIISHEHGPAGGDEINIIKAGANYGWPVITNGKDYSGATISPFTRYPGMLQPNVDWTPSIAPSGITYYTDKTIPALQNHLLVTSLKFQQIYALSFVSGTFGESVTLLSQPRERLRDITVDQAGAIWVLSDGEQATLFQLTAN